LSYRARTSKLSVRRQADQLLLGWREMT